MGKAPHVGKVQAWAAWEWYASRIEEGGYGTNFDDGTGNGGFSYGTHPDGEGFGSFLGYNNEGHGYGYGASSREGSGYSNGKMGSLTNTLRAALG